MTTALIDDPVLMLVRSALERLYGDQIERVILFGSRARGEAREDSDYDIAVFLRNVTDMAAERKRLSKLAANIFFDEFKAVHVLPWREGAWRDRTPIMHEIRKDGVDL